jgi:single-strand DNA-binding protein
MANYNKVLLMGNLTRDPELRYTPGGTAVATFGLAVNRRFKRQDGEQVDEVCFVDITAFGRQAEVVSEYLSKGRPVFVEGRLKQDTWEAQDGQKRSKLSVTLEAFQFVGGRQDQVPPDADMQQGQPRAPRPQRPAPPQPQRPGPAPQQPPRPAPAEPPPASNQEGPPPDDMPSDDIPF